ncbi:DUF2157 domain-containing protein [Vreelandella andesensis]|uniref:DUF2157 domain-containing protein n=1 Tax=Vreelandella andesensis TaxID=447567 RepID=A0A433KUD1_9GAMM|nr:DUF2157 domain-containing protein [Halomonas andesensis]RUR33299.1 DUF2157 domain-containing protein [Halomonas andesensis]
MATIRRQLMSLIEQGVIPPDQVPLAVKAAGIRPSTREWALLIDRLLLWLGGLSLACAVLFFVAFNWSDMGRLPRFALVQAALVLAVGVAVWGSANVMLFRVALTAAFLLAGVLLALLGQVYQTGADPWQLFFIWALLTLPWVGVARFDALWVLWLGLLNLSIWLYSSTWGGILGSGLFANNAGLWGLVVINLAAQAVWEWGAQRRGWPGRWAVCLLALGSGVPLTLLMVAWVSAETYALTPIVVVYPVWLAALYGVYRQWRLELFMLAGGCVSIITVATLLLARTVLWKGGVWSGQWHEGSLLLLAGAVFAMGAAAVTWLKRLNAEDVS